MHEHRLRYVAAWGRWYIWTGNMWQPDETLLVFNYARAICREASAECNERDISANIASARTVAAVERLAKADRRHAATVASMDTFTATKSERHSTDLAMLRGARMVTAQETVQPSVAGAGVRAAAHAGDLQGRVCRHWVETARGRRSRARWVELIFSRDRFEKINREMGFKEGSEGTSYIDRPRAHTPIYGFPF